MNDLRRGRVVLTASNAIQYAYEGEGIIGEAQQSVFTRHLVGGLETGDADKNHDGWISLDELYNYTYEHVLQDTPKQTPRKWAFDLQGDILIAASPSHARRVTPEEASLAMSYPDGLAALTSGKWRDALLVQTFTGTPDVILFSVAFSPDGKYIRLWDTASGQLVR